MGDFATIETCSDLTAEQAKRAASSSAELRAFLHRMQEIARPDEGCPKLLMAIARLVGQPWIEGDLRVELTGDEAHSLLTLICEYGMGIRERLVPATRFEGVPLDEFSRALHLAPALALPLRVKEEDGRIVLAPLLTPEERLKSVPAPSFEMDDKSLGENEKRTAPPIAGLADSAVNARPTPPRGFAAPTEGRIDDGWDLEAEDAAASPDAAPDASSLPLASEPSALTVVGPNPTLSDQPPTPRASAEWPIEPSAFTSVPPDAPVPSDDPMDQLIPIGDDGEPLPLDFDPTALDPVVPGEARAEDRTSGIRSPAGDDADAGPPKMPSVHTRPTVRRMVAIDVAALQKRDPRREED